MTALRADRPLASAPVAALPAEVPVAIACDASTLAVMMATPADVEDFACGFARSEGVLTSLDEIERLEVVDHGARGIEARLWLDGPRGAILAQRRRGMLGPVGCGLCGIESLEEAMRPPPSVAHIPLRLGAAEAAGATDALRRRQRRRLHEDGLHAAGFLRPGVGIALVREDVGRHNALDKVLGALLRSGADPAGGALVVSSRVSVDLVQKCCTAGCSVLIAAKTPTEAAVAAARGAGLTLVARAARGRYDVFAHPHRVD